MSHRITATTLAAVTLIGSAAHAATLAYQYNFDNVAPGTTVASPNVGTNGNLGMNLSGASTDIATAVGPSGLAGDRAINNVGVNNSPTGSSLTGSNGAPNGGNFVPPANNTLNLGTLSQFTATMWVKRESAKTTQTPFGRLFMAGGDGQDVGSATDGFAIALNRVNADTTPAVEVRVRNAGGIPVPTAGQSFTNDAWQFIAVSFDLASPNVFFSTQQQAASGGYSVNNTVIYRGSDTAPVAGFASIGLGTANNSITVTDGYAYLLNRKDLTRGLGGLGDDFRIYNGLLTIGELETIRASAVTAVPEPAAIGLLSLGALAGLRRRRRRVH